MRKFALLVCLAILSWPVCAAEKIIDTANSLNTGLTATNRLKGGIAYTNSNLYLDCQDAKQIGIEFILQSTSTGTSNVTFYVYKSMSRSSYDPAVFATYTITLSGTTPKIVVTNLTIAGIPYLYIPIFTNGLLSTEFLTNSTVWIHRKN